jgi:hypothetical protein
MLCAIALLGSASCGRFGRARECRALSSEVNSALDEIERVSTTGARDAATFRDVAARYDELAARVALLAFSDPEVKAGVEEYRTVLLGAAKNVHALANALEKRDSRELSHARLELDRLVRREKVSVLKVDAECNAP